MKGAGYTTPLFSESALKLIYSDTRGIPRLINHICTHALHATKKSGAEIVEADLIARISQDTARQVDPACNPPAPLSGAFPHYPHYPQRLACAALLIDVRTVTWVADWLINSPAIGGEKLPDKLRETQHRAHSCTLTPNPHDKPSQLYYCLSSRTITRTHDLIKDTTGQTARLFRPPFGEYNNRVIATLESLGYHTIQWSIDSLDWQKDMTRDGIITRVTSRAHPGGIVLFHNNATHTPQALEPIILKLKEDGYSFVPIGELLLTDNWYIDKGNGMQRKR